MCPAIDQMKRNPNSKPRVHLCHHPMNIVVSTLPSHLQHQPGKKLKEKRDKEYVKLPSLCFPLLQPPTIQSALTHIYYKETQLTIFVFVLISIEQIMLIVLLFSTYSRSEKLGNPIFLSPI